MPESLIDVVEPFFRVIVELGYDRSIPPWEPTPARLIPPLNPAKVAADLVNAIGEGINNALALVGSPPLLRIPAPVTLAETATEPAKADISPQMTSSTRRPKRARRRRGRNRQAPAGDRPPERRPNPRAMSTERRPNPPGDVDAHADPNPAVSRRLPVLPSCPPRQRPSLRLAPPRLSRRSLPVSRRRLGPWCAIRSGWASSYPIRPTAEMASGRPPRPPLSAMERRPADTHRPHPRQRVLRRPATPHATRLGERTATRVVLICRQPAARRLASNTPAVNATTRGRGIDGGIPRRRSRS